jgi:hypothetical protein
VVLRSAWTSLLGVWVCACGTMNEAPELADNPGNSLSSLQPVSGASVNTPAVRYPTAGYPAPGGQTHPLRVLVMIANPKDHPTLMLNSGITQKRSATWKKLVLTMKRIGRLPPSPQYSLRRKIAISSTYRSR